jgi:hypothetical protein
MDSLVDACAPIAERLVEIFRKLDSLDNIAASHDGQPRKLHPVVYWARLRAAWKQDEIEMLLDHLTTWQSQLVPRMLYHLNLVVGQSSEEQGDRFDRVDSSQSQIVEVLAVSGSKLDSIQRQNNNIYNLLAEAESRTRLRDQQIFSAILTLQNGETRLLKSDAFEDVNQDNKRQSVMTLKTSLSSGTAEASLRDFSPVQAKVLDCLYFRQFMDRYETVNPAHEQTYGWLFCDPIAEEKPWSPFMQWLEGDGGLGCYWISGKAGSGKSTLMKLVFRDPRTKQSLSRWTGQGQLGIACFFFWNLGSVLQKSQTGLFRSLLYDVISQRPYLISVIMPELLRTAATLPDNTPLAEPSYAELLRWFRKLLEQASPDFKLMFFVDGIDEYEGDHNDITALVNSSTQNRNIKFLVSSRPLPACTDAFGHLPSLRLHDLTRKDIQKFSEDYLREKFSGRFRGEWEKLIEEIVDKSCGVFLWVVLVARSLLQGLQNFDSIVELRRRLDELPSDLEDLYAHMLKRVPLVYRRQASEIFQLVLLAHDVQTSDFRLSPLQLYYACQDPQTILDAPNKPLHDSEIAAKTDEIEGRIRSRTMGLLETRLVQRGKYNRFVSGPVRVLSVDFIHKTAVEFLRIREVWDNMLDLTTSSPFVPAINLFASCIQLCKIHRPEEVIQLEDSLVWRMMDRALAYAAIAEESKSPIRLNQLDDLDNAISHHWRAATKCLYQSERFLPEEHWASGYSLSRSSPITGLLANATLPIQFDSLMVFYGLESALSETASQRLQVKNRSTILLHDATEYMLRNRDSGESEATQMRIARICSMLLKEGGDPNDTHFGHTMSPWKGMLIYACEGAVEKTRFLATLQENRLGYAYSDLVVSFIKHGANPSETIQRPDGEISALRILDDLYSASTGYGQTDPIEGTGRETCKYGMRDFHKEITSLLVQAEAKILQDVPSASASASPSPSSLPRRKGFSRKNLGLRKISRLFRNNFHS